MKFIDWFAGIGGFRKGMELAGHECVGFCEFDKYAVMSYTAMHLCTQEQLDYLATLPLKQRQKEILKDEYKNGEWYANDVRRVDARDIPEADCWCFGFPCQDISVAGKQAGFNGTRSSLFFEVMRLLDERKENGLSCPGYLFIENVKNLLSINRGIDFAKVLFALDERGFDAEWTLLNSKNFGVPQNRERVFVIGHLRERSTAEVFPVEGADGADSILRQIGGVKSSTRDNPNQYRVYDPSGISPCLSMMGGGGREPHSIEVIGDIGEKNFGKQYREGNRIYDGDKIATALKASNVGGAGGETNLYSVAVGAAERIRDSGPQIEVNNEEISNALTSNMGHSMVAIDVQPGENDSRSDVFAIDKEYEPEEREIANRIEAREDRGLSRREQEGTLICVKI